MLWFHKGHADAKQNSFNITMEPEKDMPGESTCTSCQFSEDFSVR